jgi:hypothetical protein
VTLPIAEGEQEGVEVVADSDLHGRIPTYDLYGTVYHAASQATIVQKTDMDGLSSGMQESKLEIHTCDQA